MRFSDGPEVSVETSIDAPPQRVWELCADLTRMAEWGGQENLGGEWVEGGGPKLGAHFKGRNQHNAIGEWETTSVVVECDPPRALAWAVGDPENASATWRFDLTPTASGTKLRQHVRMGPGPSGLTFAIERMPDKEERIIERRIEEHTANMTATLEGIKRAAEAG